MEHKIVSIYDVKAEAFLPPVAVQSSAAAVRSFGDAVNDPKTEFNKHPEDYTMFEIAEWDDQTAIYKPNLAPVELVKAITLLNN